MAKETNPEAIRFCKALGIDTGNRPMQWREVTTIGARCRIRDPKALAAAVAFAVTQGWLEVQDGHSVCLTEKGRRL